MKKRKYIVTLQAHAVEQPPLGLMVDKLDEATGPVSFVVRAEDAVAAIARVETILLGAMSQWETSE